MSYALNFTVIQCVEVSGYSMINFQRDGSTSFLTGCLVRVLWRNRIDLNMCAIIQGNLLGGPIESKAEMPNKGLLHAPDLGDPEATYSKKERAA